MTQKCSNCSSPLDENAKICETCNAPVNNLDKEKKNKIFNKMTVALAILVAIAGASNYGFSYYVDQCEEAALAQAKEERAKAQAQALAEQEAAKKAAAREESPDLVFEDIYKTQKTEDLQIGESVMIRKGVELTVNEVEHGVKRDNDAMLPVNTTKVTVTIKNKGAMFVRVSTYEAFGGRTLDNESEIIDIDNDGMFAVNKKNYLAPGGSITGTIYLHKDCVRMDVSPSYAPAFTPNVWWNIQQ